MFFLNLHSRNQALVSTLQWSTFRPHAPTRPSQFVPHHRPRSISVARVQLGTYKTTWRWPWNMRMVLRTLFLWVLSPEANGFVSRSSWLCHVSTLCIRMLLIEMGTGVLLTHTLDQSVFRSWSPTIHGSWPPFIHCFLFHLPLKAGNVMLHVRIVRIHWVSDPSWSHLGCPAPEAVRWTPSSVPMCYTSCTR